MNRRGKRIWGMLLAVSLLFGQVGVNAYAEETAKQAEGCVNTTRYILLIAVMWKRSQGHPSAMNTPKRVTRLW